MDQYDESDDDNNLDYEGNHLNVDRYYTRYVVSDISDQFLQSDSPQHAILHCIEKIEQDRQSQVSIDVLYNEFCNVCYDEMDKSLRKKNVNPKAKKRLWHSLKPFWNEQLSGLWQDYWYSVNYRGKDVLAKWKTEFQKLYNSEAEPCTFDDAFYTYSVHEKDRLEKEYSALHSDFNADITVDEVMKVIGKAKSRKAVGLDNIPNEVLKNDVSIQFLHKLFHKIFNTSIIPTQWKLAIIKPIPKRSSIDPKLPMQYRGISLLSTVYKLYTAVLNDRLVKKFRT